MRKKYILFALIVAILSLVSCNLDNEGILSRLPHVNRIDHKDRVFIGAKDNVFYFVSKDGLQKGDASKTETTILDDSIFEKFYLGLGWMTDDAIIYMTDEQPNVSVNEQKFYYILLSDEPAKAIEIKPSGASDSFVVIACYQIGTETYLVTKESQSSNNATIYKAEATETETETETTLKLSELPDAKPVENFADCINGLIRTSDNKYYLNGTEVKFKDKDRKDVSVGSSIKSVAYSDSGDVYAITSGFTVYKGSVSNPAEMTYVADATGSSTSIFPSFVGSDENLYFIEYMGERSPSRILTLSNENTESKFSIRNTQSNDIEASEIFKLGEEVYVLTTQYGLFSLDDV